MRRIAENRRLAGLCLVAALLAAGLDVPRCPAAEDDLETLEQRAFREAVDRVAPSVVRIETVGGLQRVGEVVYGDGPTTGLIVDAEGYVISSAFNFLNRPTSILVRLPDGALKPAELVATDHNRMLVLLKVTTDAPLPVPQIAPKSEVRVGQWAIAVGRTFEGDRPNMSVGILSATSRVWGKAIQTDAAVSPGNYGGPLIDVAGRVLGVLVPLSPNSAEEVAGIEWYDSGIGFAIDAEHIMQVLPRLKQGEDLHPGLLGISLQGGNPSIGEPVIGACQPNSPAADAGLKPGDRIVEIDGRQIERAAGVKEELTRRYAGAKVHLVVLRDDKRIEADAELVAQLEPYQHPMLGILPIREPVEEGGVSAKEATEPAKETGASSKEASKPPEVADKPSGVTVRYVYANGPAAVAGIQPGDRLITFAEKPIPDRDALLQQIAALKPDDEVTLELRRGEETLTPTVKLGRLPEDLPPETLPAARGDPGPVDGELPQVGTVALKIPEFNNDAWAYVPEKYHSKVGHGIVVWLHGPGEMDFDEALKRWKPLCDAHDLILLAPKAEDPAAWKPGEAALVVKLIDEIRSTYTIDPTRIVLHGHQGGATLAYAIVWANRELVRAVAAVDAPPVGRPRPVDPLNRLAVYTATAKKSPHAAAVRSGVQKLRDVKIPVTAKDLGDDPRYLTPEELAELVRWIDMLDRI